VLNNLIAGILIYGGMGYLIGLYFDRASVGLAIGAVFGLAASTVLVFYRLRQLDSGSKPQQEA
jgi:F0F1-type ATP synthase assembly protein I